MTSRCMEDDDRRRSKFGQKSSSACQEIVAKIGQLGVGYDREDEMVRIVWWRSVLSSDLAYKWLEMLRPIVPRK